MIHRAPFGSLERFVGVLIEHCGGNFPVWLAPVQVKVLPIADDQVAYAREVAQTLQARGYRVEVDTRNEKVGYKIRQAELAKIPYMLVLGKREVEEQCVNVRRHGEQAQVSESLADFMVRIQGDIDALIGSSSNA
jgi:threonyl-tRNA synthetase